MFDLRRLHGHESGIFLAKLPPIVAVTLLTNASIPLQAYAQSIDPVKIGLGSGNFTGSLLVDDQFGASVTNIGDLDGDDVIDLAVGSPGRGKGAIWILFMNRDGTVKSSQEISETQGNFDGMTSLTQQFGLSVATLGRLDDDAFVDIFAVNRGGARGSFVIFLDESGKVKRHVNPRLILPVSAGFWTINSIGDIEGDGRADYALGIDRADVWQLNVDTAGFVTFNDLGISRHDHPDIFKGATPSERFGLSVASLHDFDGDGARELVVGDPATFSGEVWLVTMVPSQNHPGLEAVSAVPLSEQGSLPNDLSSDDQFGTALASLGDLDGDGIPELGVGAPGDDGNRGAVWILFFDVNGKVRASAKMDASVRGLTGRISDGDRFGTALADLGDLDGNGTKDLAIGAPRTSDGAPSTGAVWIFFGLGDVIPPSIAPVEAAGIPTLGEQVLIEADVASVADVESVTLEWRAGGVKEFFPPALMARSGVRYSGNAYTFSERGIEYRIEATTVTGSISRFPSFGFGFIPTYLPGGIDADVPRGRERSAYRMISVPLDLDLKSVRDVLEDDLGAYDPADWRLFDVVDGGQLVELGESEPEFQPGKAFWLLAESAGKRFNTGPGKSVATNRPLAVGLSSGWNLIGNPYSFPVTTADVHTRSGLPTQFVAFNGQWVPTDTLAPFAGVAVRSEHNDSLYFEPAGREVADGTQASNELSVEHRQQLETLFGPTMDGRGSETSAPLVQASGSFPNPATETAAISFRLSRRHQVRVRIFDALGRLVDTPLDEFRDAGEHRFLWRAENVSPGVYFYRIDAGESVKGGSMVITH